MAKIVFDTSKMIVVEFCPFDEVGYITIDKLKVGDVYLCLCDQEQKTKSMVSAKFAYKVTEILEDGAFTRINADCLGDGFGQTQSYFSSDEVGYVYLVGEENGVKIE